MFHLKPIFSVIWSKLFTRFEAKSAIWNDIFLALQRFLLRYEVIFYCDIKLIMRLYCDMKRNPLSKANFSILRDFFERYKQNNAISSKIRNLQQIFQSEANLYCDIKRIYTAIWSDFPYFMKRNPLFEVIFSIWRVFFVGYQTNFQAISSQIRNLKRIFRSDANLYCAMK